MKLLTVIVLLIGCALCHAEDSTNQLSAADLLTRDVEELEKTLAAADNLILQYEQEVISDPPRRMSSDAKVDLVAEIMIRQIEIWRVRQKDHDRLTNEIKQPSLSITTSLKTPKGAQQPPRDK